jgi:hypothetical protein
MQEPRRLIVRGDADRGQADAINRGFAQAPDADIMGYLAPATYCCPELSQVDGLHPAGNHVLAPPSVGAHRPARCEPPLRNRLGFHSACSRRRFSSLQAAAAIPRVLQLA